MMHASSSQRSVIIVTLTFAASLITVSNSFVPISNPSHFHPTATTTTNPQKEQDHVGSALYALPPMIIGPMIRKMREEQAKKKMPLISRDEAIYDAPGLRVGRGAWKWPPVWPYDNTFFKTYEDLKPDTPTLKNMASMLSGVPQFPTPEEVAATEKEKNELKFQPMPYWTEEVVDVTTDLDPDAAEKLTSHYRYYLQDGMSILEFGAAEKSYLPEELKLSRHVGVGANLKLMDRNPSLTQKLVVDLNDAVEDRDVNSDELRQLSTEPFDAIIMSNTVDFLTSPREVFRSAWHLLKPGGIFIVSFSNKEAEYSAKFKRAQTRMWRDFNDDQHMWIVGSFFQFSAGEGWDNLKGFDISPESAKEADAGPLAVFKGGKYNNMYVVQATKGVQEESIDPENPEKSFSSKMWMLPVVESRDKQLLAPRLARAYQQASTDEEKQALEYNVDLLPTVYESLIRMDQFTFTFSMQSTLAADLISDPCFVGNDEQVLALKEGLGLRTPTEKFWAPVGQLTSAMTAEDKINLLSYIVPRFGSGDPDQEAALESFVTGLKPTFAAIRAKCPDLSEGDVQLLGTELLAAEILKPGRSTRVEFAAWVSEMSSSELKDILAARKLVRDRAVSDLNAYRQAKEEEKARIEERRKKIEEQVDQARRERNIMFNRRTGKFEEIKK